MKNIEKKSIHLKKNKNNQKINDFKKRKRDDDVFVKKSNENRFNVIIEFNKNKKTKTIKNKKNLSKIICYNCQKKTLQKRLFQR